MLKFDKLLSDIYCRNNLSVGHTISIKGKDARKKQIQGGINNEN